MDRLEFMEDLNDEIKKLTERKEKLQSECSTAYKYTIEYVRTVLKEPEVSKGVDNAISSNSVGFFGTIRSDYGYNQTNIVTDDNSTEQIIRLSSTITQLKNDCNDLEEKLKKYKKDDVRNFFPFLEDK